MSELVRLSLRFRAMACDNTIEIFAQNAADGEAALEDARDEVLRIEAKYSRYRDDSVVSKINRNAGGAATPIDAETAQLLAFADAAYGQSDGLFDITSGVLRRVWNFKIARVPTRDELAAVLPLVAWRDVHRTDSSIRLPYAGMELDFGGFGKEYAADRAAAVLFSHGINHGFVELGGDVVVTGPQPDGSPWSLGVRHPRRESTLVHAVSIESGAVATSGDYERYFELDGIRYSHLLSPLTGMPTRGLQSVTVFASSCLVAGALSTIAMLRGRSGEAWLQAAGARALVVPDSGDE